MCDPRDQFPVGMRVLAVDDDPTCLFILENLLRKCQYQGLLLLLLILLLILHDRGFGYFDFLTLFLLKSEAVLLIRSWDWDFRICYYISEWCLFLVIIDDGWWIFFFFAVTTTSQAITALQMLRENKDKYDLVISDVQMPDMDGFKLLELVGLEMDLPVISKHTNTIYLTSSFFFCFFLLVFVLILVIDEVT